jgi:hypothetical protein
VRKHRTRTRARVTVIVTVALGAGLCAATGIPLALATPPVQRHAMQVVGWNGEYPVPAPQQTQGQVQTQTAPAVTVTAPVPAPQQTQGQVQTQTAPAVTVTAPVPVPQQTQGQVQTQTAPAVTVTAPVPVPQQTQGQVQMPWTPQKLAAAVQRGWSSGASGSGVKDGSFGSWRGSPVGIIGTWADTTAEVQTNVKAVDELQGWDGDVDLAVGGTAVDEEAETYAKAAAGEYRDRWVTMARKIEQARGQAQGTTYVRPWHEFNGDWYDNWQVTRENAEDYKKAFRLMAGVLRENCPSCVIVWSPNNGSSKGSASIDESYPGEDVVDVISVDSYNANGNPIVTDQASWDEYANATEGSDPVGVEAWRTFAERHGKPIGFSEWGLNPGGGGGDNPEYIKRMNAWMTDHAATPGEVTGAGKVLYDVYFNVNHGGTDRFKIKDGPNVESGKVYQSLKWGVAGSPASQVAQTAGQPTQTTAVSSVSPRTTWFQNAQPQNAQPQSASQPQVAQAVVTVTVTVAPDQAAPQVAQTRIAQLPSTQPAAPGGAGVAVSK